MAINEQQANSVKTFVASLPKEKQTEFVNRYKALDAPNKEALINKIYSTSPTQEVAGDETGLAGAIGGAAGLGAVGYGATKAAGYVGKVLGNAPKVISPKKGSAFAQDIRGAFVQAHTDKVNEFGAKIDELSANNPTKKIDLRSVADELEFNWEDLSPETKSAVKKTPYLKDMIKQTMSGKKPIPTQISLRQSQDLINHINTKVPSKIRANNIELLETINNIRGSQLEVFDEMGDVRAKYKEFIKPYNQIKSQFRFGKLLDNIQKKFGGAEQEMAVRQILPKEVIKKMGGYRAAANILKPQLLKIMGFAGIAPQIMQAGNIAQEFDKFRKQGGFLATDPMGGTEQIDPQDVEKMLKYKLIG